MIRQNEIKAAENFISRGDFFGRVDIPSPKIENISVLHIRIFNVREDPIGPVVSRIICNNEAEVYTEIADMALIACSLPYFPELDL